MPTRELMVYARALPALAAQRHLEAAQETAVGTGSLKPGARDSIVRRWRSEIRAAATRPRSPGQLQAMASAAGIGFRRVTVPRGRAE